MLIKLRGGQDLMHVGMGCKKIISRNVTTSFFICVFKFALKTRDCTKGRGRRVGKDNIISKKGEKIISMTYL